MKDERRGGEGETEGATGRMEEKEGAEGSVHQALQVLRGLRMREEIGGGEAERALEARWTGWQGATGAVGTVKELKEGEADWGRGNEVY